MNDLFNSKTQAKLGSLKCLGQTFPSDELRREHYPTLLAKQLKETSFHKNRNVSIGTTWQAKVIDDYSIGQQLLESLSDTQLLAVKPIKMDSTAVGTLSDPSESLCTAEGTVR